MLTFSDNYNVIQKCVPVEAAASYLYYVNLNNMMF